MASESADQGQTATSERTNLAFDQLDDAEFLFSGLHDRSGTPVVLIIGAKFDAWENDSEVPLAYFLERVQEVAARGAYRVVYVHSQASLWSNSPGLWWLWRAYHSRVPAPFRSNLERLTVVHAGPGLRAAMALLCPFAGDGLWQKVEFLPRAEFLTDSIAPGQLDGLLAGWVAAHDAELQRQPLMDAGLVVDPEKMAAHGDTLGLPGLGRA